MAENAEGTVEERIQQFLMASEGGDDHQDDGQEQPERAQRRERRDQQPERATVQDDDDPVEQRTEAGDQDEGGEEPDDIEEIQVSSLQDLADALDIDVADLYKVPIPISTRDGRKEVTLGEWKDSIQASENIKARETQLAEMEKQRQEALSTFTQELEQQRQMTSAVLNMAEATLMRDYRGINWEELRQVDPGEFAAKQSEFNARYAEVQQAKQQAVHNYQQQMVQMQQRIRPEQEKNLTDRIPDWKDENTAKVEKREVVEYLTSRGFMPQEIDSVYDARLVELSYKAMKYDKLKATPAAKKKVLKIGGKPIKPGKAQSKAERRNEQISDQRQRFRKSGNVSDLAALLNSDEYLGDL